MDEKQIKTLKRVVNKVNALRATLSKSERTMLDSLILGSPAQMAGAAEVEGHSLKAEMAVATGAAAAAASSAAAAVASQVRAAVQYNAAKDAYAVQVAAHLM